MKSGDIICRVTKSASGVEWTDGSATLRTLTGETAVHFLRETLTLTQSCCSTTITKFITVSMMTKGL